MCGILAAFSENELIFENFSDALQMQISRGPDSQNIKYINNGVLGHARLSIHDLSVCGNQPMTRFDKYSIIFNGEIYNFRELREEIRDKYEFESDSDTEVLLYSLIESGVETTLSKVRGMFAFTFVNSECGDVFFARDEFGEKPLYYSLVDRELIVSSSLFSLVKLKNRISYNLQSISTYLHYGYCKGSQTPIENVFKLPPKHFAHYNLNSGFFEIKEYDIHFEDKYEHFSLDQLLRSSVEECLDADVEVGCFLSGGVDSSLIASYINEHRAGIKAFCLGFDNSEYDESESAIKIANQLGLDIEVLKLSENDLVDIVKDMSKVFDEPFADASFLATYCISKHARKSVKVVLSGDGGDELFSGYNRHLLVGKIYDSTVKVPLKLRQFISQSIQQKSFSFRAIRFLLKTFWLKNKKITALDEKITKLGILLPYVDKSDLLFKVLAGYDYSGFLDIPEPFKHQVEDLSLTPRQLSLLDLKSYLHEDVLVKVDRSTMATSLEARSPFLNRYIFRYSQQADDVEHINNGKQKYALRTLLSSKLALEPYEKPKSGFSVPYAYIVDNKLKNEFLELRNMKVGKEVDNFNSKLFKLADSYYEGDFYDVKFIWNIYCYLVWLKNINDI